MKVDAYGRVILDSEDLFDAIYRDENISRMIGAGAEIKTYNDLCRYNDKSEFIIPEPEHLDFSPEEEHARRQNSWFIPEQYQTIELWDILASRCSTQAELDRLALERTEYEVRDLVPVLRLMVYLVDHFRSRSVVWGVGRGSSVASFVLYLIGIIKINPMLFGLEIGEFLRD